MLNRFADVIGGRAWGEDREIPVDQLAKDIINGRIENAMGLLI